MPIQIWIGLTEQGLTWIIFSDQVVIPIYDLGDKKNLAPWARIQTGFNRMALQESVIHSVGVFKFVGIDEYILIIFIGPKIDEYKLILANFYRAPMNIRAVGFGFDRTTIFVSEATSPMNIRVLYSLVTWPHRRI
jgi:hypothetical protein